MKVLLCHAYYMQRGGEDCCFEEERDLLRGAGVEVVEYVRRNSEMTALNSLVAAATTLWNRQAAREINGLIARERPDVFHLTNTFPLISPASCQIAHRAGTAVVHALQNYRLLCAGGYLMRDGKPCHECVGRLLPWPAVVHRCYRDSASASSAVAAMQIVHRALRTWSRRVDAFFAPSEAARQQFITAGFPADRVHVKSNSVAGYSGVGTGGGGYFAFVGRLSSEKGVATLLDAWRTNPGLPPLEIAGDGPMAERVQTAAAADARITWHGRLSAAEVHQLAAEAIALVMPSLWHETFGRTTVEAFAGGTPVVASRLGAMIELVSEGRTGWLFEPGDHVALAATLDCVARLPASEMATLRRSAHAAYEAHYTPQRNLERLMEIYELALGQRGRAPAGGRRIVGPSPTASTGPIVQNLPGHSRSAKLSV